MGLTQRGYARHRKAEKLSGGSLKAVQKALAEARIVLEPDGSIDPVKADVAWEANTPQRRGGIPSSPPPEIPTDTPPTLPKAGPKPMGVLLREHERVKITERRLKVRRQQERLVPRAPVERALFERTRRLRDALQAWPAELAPLVIAITGGELRPVLDLLEREARKFLERMVVELSHELPKARGAA